MTVTYIIIDNQCLYDNNDNNNNYDVNLHGYHYYYNYYNHYHQYRPVYPSFNAFSFSTPKSLIEGAEIFTLELCINVLVSKSMSLR